MRRFPHLSKANLRLASRALVALMLASSPTAFAEPAPVRVPAAIILTNGRIYTGDEAQPAATAIAIRDAHVIAVGSDVEIEATADATTQRIDLKGRRVVPGINDAHEHLGWQPAPGVGLGLSEPEPTSEELEAKLKAMPTDDPTWIRSIIGGAIFTDLRWNRARLDRLQPNRPVILLGFTGHGMLLNSAAMRLLGVKPDVEVPGGWYGRDAEGEFDGRVHEYAQHRIYARLPREGDAADIERLQAYATEASQLGITSVQSMNWLPLKTFVDDWQRAGAPQRMRAIRWPEVTADPDPMPGLDLPKQIPGTRIEVSGTKWILDGTIVEQDSPMRASYPDTGRNGRLDFSPAELRSRLQEILARRDQILLHVIGDATTASVFKTLASIAPPEAWRDKRLRIEHGDGLAPDLIPLAKDFGVIVVINPSHQMLPPDHPAVRLIQARQLSPMADLIKAGIPVAIGSDGPNSPWLNMMFATQVPTRPDQSLTREQVLRAYTQGSAFAEFKEQEKGRLMPGYLADLVVLSQDVLDEQAVPTQALPATRSLLTMIDGGIVWRDQGF